MSGSTLRRAAEAGLVAVAAVWGLTFVMVQDAIALLPTMAFLAYRFLPTALLVALVFRRRLGSLSGEGVRAGVAMGVFLTAGYALQTLGLERTSASNAGFITGLFVVLTPLLGALVLRQPVTPVAWAAAVVSALGLYLLSGAGGDFELRGDGLVLLCAIAFSAHILATGRAVERHAPPARTALILASEPAFAGLFGWLLADERLSPVALLGAALILMAIVAVEVVPRLRPPRPLPEG